MDDTIVKIRQLKEKENDVDVMFIHQYKLQTAFSANSAHFLLPVRGWPKVSKWIRSG